LAATPSILTLSGTDINHDYDHPDRRRQVEEAIKKAAVIVTYNRSIADRIPRARVIPKGVTLGDAPFDLRAVAALQPGDFIFLHPGGIRPVKNPLLAIDALAPIHPAIRLVFAGPILDPAYGREFSHRVASEPWIRHLPHIQPTAMHAAYRAADVVLNTSLSEGLSNAIMEAMLAGRAILATDIPGNRDLIEDGATGLLFRGPNDFQDKAALLFRDPDRRRDLGRAAQNHARACYSTEREVDALLQAYGDARINS
jgi:glycosyltransferase involved in cell wall biosynthesis